MMPFVLQSRRICPRQHFQGRMSTLFSCRTAGNRYAELHAICEGTGVLLTTKHAPPCPAKHGALWISTDTHLQHFYHVV